jgi:hypothetical protein
MRQKIRSVNKQSIRQVVKLAGRMADKIDRLRYLRGTVTVGPGTPCLHAMAVWIVAAAVCAMVVALVLWTKF